MIDIDMELEVQAIFRKAYECRGVPSRLYMCADFFDRLVKHFSLYCMYDASGDRLLDGIPITICEVEGWILQKAESSKLSTVAHLIK